MKNPDDKPKTSVRRRRIIRIIPGVIILTLVIYLARDYFGPCKISLKNDTAFELPCLRAKDLIVQEYDPDGTLWASRGMIIYKLPPDQDRFIKVAHVPTGMSVFWLRNFSILRRYTVRPECIEMVTTANGDICALSAGKMWYLQAGKKRFIKTLDLEHYGFGDQGMRNDGILCTDDSTLYFGEYFFNAERTGVNLYRSHNSGKSWEIAWHFPEGQIRHIHAVQKDPYSGNIWICTGDHDDESMVAFSADSFKTLTAIGSGNQLWRVCQLVFSENDVYWGTDTSHETLKGIYKWNRESRDTTKLQPTDGAVFYGVKLAGGTMVMSTDREGMCCEKDNNTRIYIVRNNDKVTCLKAGTWKKRKSEFRFKFAKLRFQRDQGAPSLAISYLSQQEFHDGDLVIISEDTLVEAAGSNQCGIKRQHKYDNVITGCISKEK